MRPSLKPTRQFMTYLTDHEAMRHEIKPYVCFGSDVMIDKYKASQAYWAIQVCGGRAYVQRLKEVDVVERTDAQCDFVLVKIKCERWRC